MIQQALDVLAAGINTHLATVLAGALEPSAATLGTAFTAVVDRTLIEEKDYLAVGVGVQVEQASEVTETWPFEAQDRAPEVPVTVTCWVSRVALPALSATNDNGMIAASRALARGVAKAIRRTLEPAGAVLREGVQVRCPASITYSEPAQGNDGSLTVVTLTLSVPVFDTLAHSAGSY
jgi:hypothetical protein